MAKMNYERATRRDRQYEEKRERFYDTAVSYQARREPVWATDKQVLIIQRYKMVAADKIIGLTKGEASALIDEFAKRNNWGKPHSNPRTNPKYRKKTPDPLASRNGPITIRRIDPQDEQQMNNR